MAQGETLESFCPSSLQSMSASTPESLHDSPQPLRRAHLLQPQMDSLIARVEAGSRVKVKTSLPLVQKLHASRIDHYLELRNRCLAGPVHRPEVVFWLDKMISALNGTCCKAVTGRLADTCEHELHTCTGRDSSVAVESESKAAANQGWRLNATLINVHPPNPLITPPPASHYARLDEGSVESALPAAEQCSRKSE